MFECLDELDVDIASVAAFAFCEGPGSILGIRTTAMALRMWNVLKERPLYAYVGLAVVARAVGRPEVGVIADARRGLWHCLHMGGPLLRVPAAELPGELMTPEGFRHWDPLPAGTVTTSYDLATLLETRRSQGPSFSAKPGTRTRSCTRSPPMQNGFPRSTGRHDTVKLNASPALLGRNRPGRN